MDLFQLMQTLTGQGAVSPLCNTCLLLKAGREYPKRPIWVSPSRVVALGGNITIRCESQYPGMDFFLRKAGHPNPQMKRVYGRTVAEFPISSVSRENGGSYTCDYRPITPFAVSYPSDPVELVVRDPNLPRPSISLSPTGVTTPGADVTIRCQGQRRYVRFFLHKAGDPNPQQHMDAAGDGAEYRIPTVGRQHGGSYSCSYRPRSEPFVSSHPSDPLRLVVAGEGPGSTSQLPAPHPAGPWEGEGVLCTDETRDQGSAPAAPAPQPGPPSLLPCGG
uniref:Ig-like domain-containing protein n=1 Tax=Chrysemys picta bellii TaxID=8478 RepID=A0A8C3HVF4_CHRPI